MIRYCSGFIGLLRRKSFGEIHGGQQKERSYTKAAE
jgi:hypothetical protein